VKLQIVAELKAGESTSQYQQIFDEHGPQLKSLGDAPPHGCVQQW